MAVVEVDDLHIAYGPVVAVDGLSLRADAGEVVAVLGPNGAGKTSTIEALEGFRTPARGSVRVAGLDPIADHAALTRRIGVMLQGGGVYPGARPGEMLELFARFYEQPLAVRPLLARVGLGDKARRPWRALSGGEQQRLSLALALIGQPDVLFLDEPTAGVDVSGRQVIRQIIAEQRERGTCVLVTTHDLDEAEKIADRIVIVDHGQVVGEGTPAELSAGGVEARFGAPPGLDAAALGAAVGAPVDEVIPGQYVVRAEPTPALVAALAGWLAEHDVALGDLRAGRQRLEDVFLALTTAEPEDEEPAGRRRRGRARR